MILQLNQNWDLLIIFGNLAPCVSAIKRQKAVLWTERAKEIEPVNKGEHTTHTFFEVRSSCSSYLVCIRYLEYHLIPKIYLQGYNPTSFAILSLNFPALELF